MVTDSSDSLNLDEIPHHPEVSFRDENGYEWRIRRALSFKSPWRPRWRVEEKTGDHWVLHAVAESKTTAQERMHEIRVGSVLIVGGYRRDRWARSQL
jgi:hypothetical protein